MRPKISQETTLDPRGTYVTRPGRWQTEAPVRTPGQTAARKRSQRTFADHAARWCRAAFCKACARDLGHRVSNRSNGIAGEYGFAQRLSPLIAACGVVAVPSLLVRHQARLHLSNAEVIYLLHVLSYRWDGDHWPWVAVSAIADRSGVHSGVVRRWKASLEAKGYLVCKPRVIPGVGRRADEHDLSRLFAALEALALEEETQKALDKVRGDLPDAQYHRGLATTPQLSTGRPGKKMRARPHENAGARPGENAGAPRTKTKGTDPAKTPGEVETGQAERSNRTRPQSPFQEEDIQRAGAARPETTNLIENDPISIGDDDAPPGYLDDGITSYIVQWGVELGDDDTERSLERAV